MKKGQFVLTGVILVGGQHLAMLRDTATGKAERVEQGQEIRGMLAERVEAGLLVLKLGGDQEELHLQVQRAAPEPAESKPPEQSLPAVSGKVQVSVSEPVRRLDTDEQRIAEAERQRLKQLDHYREINRLRAEKGMPQLTIPSGLLTPVSKP